MSPDTSILIAVGLGLVLLVLWPFYRRQRKLERKTVEAQATALRHGLHEPATLHPIVHPGACIGIGNCLSVCPEGFILGLHNGQAQPISPARCVGHGLCERVCPVEAISLVFGTATRGVDIPRTQANFETNVPGLYIIGELGGMGLIRTAFEQARRCVEGIAKQPRAPRNVLDVLIVGCGPAGLAASLHCLHRRLRFKTIEREDIGGTVRYYPRKKLVLTAPVTVPGYGRLKFREILKEKLIALWGDIVAKAGLQVQTEESVSDIHRDPDGYFTVTTTKAAYRAQRVLLAIGRRGVPRKLDIPGEDSPKVIYSLLEPEAYQHDRIVVVGGGDSAIEAALALADQPGNEVTISYRRDKFSRIKPRNLERIEDAIARRHIDVLWSTSLTEIKPHAVAYKTQDGRTDTIANDLVAVFAGGVLPTKFLTACGIAIDTKFGEP